MGEENRAINLMKKFAASRLDESEYYKVTDARIKYHIATDVESKYIIKFPAYRTMLGEAVLNLQTNTWTLTIYSEFYSTAAFNED